VHLRRASLDTMSGKLDDAQQRLTQVDGLQGAHLEFQIDVAVGLSEVALWRNDPSVALRRCIDTASIAAPTDASLFAGPLLVLAARAAADRAEQGGRTSSRTTARQTLQQLQALRAEMTVDPLAGRAVPATSAANT